MYHVPTIFFFMVFLDTFWFPSMLLAFGAFWCCIVMPFLRKF